MTRAEYKALCERVCEAVMQDLADAIEMRDAAKHRFRRNTADARLSALATELGFEVVPDRLPLVRLGPGGDFVHDIWGKDAP